MREAAWPRAAACCRTAPLQRACVRGCPTRVVVGPSLLAHRCLLRLLCLLRSPGATLTSKEKLEIAKKLSQLGEPRNPVLGSVPGQHSASAMLPNVMGSWACSSAVVRVAAIVRSVLHPWHASCTFLHCCCRGKGVPSLRSHFCLHDHQQPPARALPSQYSTRLLTGCVHCCCCCRCAGVDIIEAGFPIASPDDFEAVRLPLCTCTAPPLHAAAGLPARHMVHQPAPQLAAWCIKWPPSAQHACGTPCCWPSASVSAMGAATAAAPAAASSRHGTPCPHLLLTRVLCCRDIPPRCAPLPWMWAMQWMRLATCPSSAACPALVTRCAQPATMAARAVLCG